MTYTKNPEYWDAENVQIETLQFMLSDDDTAVFSAYNAGDLDFIDSVPDQRGRQPDRPEPRVPCR